MLQNVIFKDDKSILYADSSSTSLMTKHNRMNKCFIGMFIVVNSIWHEKVLPKPLY